MSCRYSMSPSSTHFENIDRLTLRKGIFDNIYISKNIIKKPTITEEIVWDYDTILRCKFNGNLTGGSLDYTLSSVDGFIIKRREYGTFKWLPLKKITIFNKNNLDFEFFDKYNRSNVEYEYGVFPLSSGIEGTPITKRIESKFNGIFIVEKDNIFGSIFEARIDELIKVRPKSIITTKGSRYPFVVSNGNNNYYEGGVSAIFAPVNLKDCTMDVKNAWKYRESLMDFLQNGKPKILKDFDGRAYIIAVADNPQSSISDGYPKIVTSFRFVQTGNADNVIDLLDNGLLPDDIRRDWVVV